MIVYTAGWKRTPEISIRIENTSCLSENLSALGEIFAESDSAITLCVYLYNQT